MSLYSAQYAKTAYICTNKSKNIVKITEKGKEVTKEFVKIINQIEDEIFSEYTNEEKEKLKVTLRELSKKYYELNP